MSDKTCKNKLLIPATWFHHMCEAFTNNLAYCPSLPLHLHPQKVCSHTEAYILGLPRQRERNSTENQDSTYLDTQDQEFLFANSQHRYYSCRPNYLITEHPKRPNPA